MSSDRDRSASILDFYDFPRAATAPAIAPGRTTVTSRIQLRASADRPAPVAATAIAAPFEAPAPLVDPFGLHLLHAPVQRKEAMHTQAAVTIDAPKEVEESRATLSVEPRDQREVAIRPLGGAADQSVGSAANAPTEAHLPDDRMKTQVAATIDAPKDAGDLVAHPRLTPPQIATARRRNPHHAKRLRFDAAAFGGGSPGSAEFALAVAAFQASTGGALGVDGIAGPKTCKLKGCLPARHGHGHASHGHAAPHEIEMPPMELEDEGAEPHEIAMAPMIIMPPMTIGAGAPPEGSAAPVQGRASGPRALGADEVHAHAAAGVEGAGGPMPHAAQIKASFGAHAPVVDQIHAHVGGAAASAAAAIGAEAYATGNAVAFQASPDLFTAAHEAAHVVQQRAGVHLLGGVGEVGDVYERHADEVAARVVAGESAEALLGGGASATASAGVQRKEQAAGEAPSHAAAGGATVIAVRAHVKLTTTRMYAAASNMLLYADMPIDTMAGGEPIAQGLQQTFTIVMNDLDSLRAEAAKVPDLLAGTLTPDLGALRGAWAIAPQGLAYALARAHNLTHDKDGKPAPQFASYTGSARAAANRLQAVFAAFRVNGDELAVVSLPPTAMADLKGAVAAAGTEALDDGIRAVQACTGRLVADLEAPDRQKDEASELVVALSTVESAHKAIDAKHVAPLTAALHQVEALQSALARRTDPRSQAIADTIGFGSTVAATLQRLKQHLKDAGGTRKHR